MLNISVFIRETHGIQRKGEPISFGAPFKQGLIYNQDELLLFDQEKELPTSAVTTAFWPDKSIKWALVSGQVDLQENESKTLLLLKKHDTNNCNVNNIKINEINEHLVIKTGKEEFILGNDCLIPLPVSYVNSLEGKGIAANIALKGLGKHILETKILNRRVVNNGSTSIILSEGCFINENSSDGKLPLEFESRATFYANKSLVKWQFTIANPNAALHPGGKWDLGDQGSHYFKDLSLEIPLTASTETSYKLQWHNSLSRVLEKHLSIFQCSSGGENWSSNNHVNKQGKMPLQFKGYRVFNGKENVVSGERASPYVFAQGKGINLAVNIEHFWQNFPKAISIEQNKLRLSLFPQESADDFELQAGEQKTHSIHFDFSKTHEDLIGVTNPIELSLSPQYIASTKAITWLCENVDDNPLTDLIIEKGLSSKNNFYAKREKIDEFGWRNFGEIYADHESLGHKGEAPLISHYNNQYDPILGFARMYLQTGDNRWFELMNDLAQHIVDIDIYNTDLDRAEYNRGLFWHTDHYLDAETCTHRTFSKHHTAVYQDHTGGGGPGDEHCYTSGLTAHYFLTGNEQSKSTVVNLANWFIALQEGTGLLLERILRAKKKDLKLLKRLMKGEKLPKVKYPLTRGTCNYMSTLMDAYSLTGQRHYFDLLESVIRQTIHPVENISLRRLDIIELGWSYTIVLQGLAKYLELKAGMSEFDDSYYYARDSLMHYCDWMLKNESPYLANPEQLEFPNKTWVAQDLRKAHILFISSQYTDKPDEYIEKARFFLDYVITSLQDDAETEYARLLILLMQNQGPEGCFPQNEKEESRYIRTAPDTYGGAPLYSTFGVLKDLSVDLVKRLMKLSFNKEKQWLKFRADT